MADTTSKWRSTFYALMQHPAEPRLLLLPAGHRWSLPACRFAGRLPVTAVDTFNAALRERFGWHATVLRCLYRRQDEARQHHEAVFQMELHEPAVVLAPPGTRWADRAALKHLPLTGTHRHVLEAWLAGAEQPHVPPERMPWSRPGWFATAAQWVTEHLRRLGRVPIGPVEQVRNVGVACVLRAHTAAGNVYFKTTVTGPPIFADEAEAIRLLSSLFPRHIPALLASDAARGWLLVDDAGPSLDAEQELRPWETAMRCFAELQRACVDHTADLLAARCADRRLGTLASHVNPLLADDAALSGLTSDERARLRRLSPRLRAMCDELAAFGIPAALVHGDLHGGNIGVRDGQPVFYDWTDACIAHPFFDATTYISEAPFNRVPGARDRLRDVYLAVWDAYAPPATLRRACALAGPLGALHYAVSFQYCVRAMDPADRWQLAWGVPMAVRALLDSMVALERTEGQP